MFAGSCCYNWFLQWCGAPSLWGSIVVVITDESWGFEEENVILDLEGCDKGVEGHVWDGIGVQTLVYFFKFK